MGMYAIQYMRKSVHKIKVESIRETRKEFKTLIDDNDKQQKKKI
jgi:hypothetical protein